MRAFMSSVLSPAAAVRHAFREARAGRPAPVRASVLPASATGAESVRHAFREARAGRPAPVRAGVLPA
jgi:hypothetical protein